MEPTTSTFFNRLKQNHSDLCITELCILEVELNTFFIKVFQMMPLVQNWICPRGDMFTFNYIEKNLVIHFVLNIVKFDETNNALVIHCHNLLNVYSWQKGCVNLSQVGDPGLSCASCFLYIFNNNNV